MRIRFPHSLFLLTTLLLALILPQQALAAKNEINAGYRSLVAWLPGSGVRVDVSVWYPTQRSPSLLRYGSWEFRAARNAAPLQGSWPILLLSPDSTGSRFAHHDLATALAMRGIIVAVPTHDGDNIDDMRLLFTANQLPARARQLSATLDLILNDQDLGSVANAAKVALLGFGNGGSAGLLLAGAEQSPDLWPNFCEPQQRALLLLSSDSPYCEPLMAHNINRMTLSMRAEDRLEKEARHNRDKAEEARQEVLKNAKAGVAKAYQQILRTQKRPAIQFPSPPVFLPLLPPLPYKAETYDPRFRAMILVSPGYSMLFEPESLQSISIPMYIVLAEKDTLNLPEEQGLRLRRLIAPPTPEYSVIKDADLPSFQALCPPDIARDLPDLCASVSPQKREQIHNQLERVVVQFLR